MDGVVNVLKPPGMTSSNVVADVRRLYGMKRVGHTGTLDPGAAGVLPICLGRATRLFDILVDKQKEYIAEIAFGSCTDTQDSYGVITRNGPADVGVDALQAVLPMFTGAQKQVAPAYSALKADGKPLYAIAREGGKVPRREREIFVQTLEYIAATAHNRHLLRILCSRGTYVRTLCEDIGHALGTCAHMSFLLRTRSGEFTIEDAYSLEELAALQQAGRLADSIWPVERVLARLCDAHISAADAKRLHNGVPVGLTQPHALEDGALCRVYTCDTFLGVGEYSGGSLRLKLHF